jgi:hypothetical protein
MASMGMLPTPTSMEDRSNIETWEKRMETMKDKGMSSFAMPLSMKAKMGMLPTPRSSDERMHWRTENWKGDDLGSEINHILGTRSHLNPQFVAEMMGFPTDWTILPFQSGETKALKDMEMP